MGSSWVHTDDVATEMVRILSDTEKSSRPYDPFESIENLDGLVENNLQSNSPMNQSMMSHASLAQSLSPLNDNNKNNSVQKQLELLYEFIRAKCWNALTSAIGKIQCFPWTEFRHEQHTWIVSNNRSTVPSSNHSVSEYEVDEDALKELVDMSEMVMYGPLHATTILNMKQNQSNIHQGESNDSSHIIASAPPTPRDFSEYEEYELLRSQLSEQQKLHIRRRQLTVKNKLSINMKKEYVSTKSPTKTKSPVITTPKKSKTYTTASPAKSSKAISPGKKATLSSNSKRLSKNNSEL